jgi:hypothetical protein
VGELEIRWPAFLEGKFEQDDEIEGPEHCLILKQEYSIFKVIEY